jgi:hypothetical protein
MYLPLCTTANKQGRIAGENAASGNAKFKGIVVLRFQNYFGDDLSSFIILGCQLSIHTYQQLMHLRL